MRTNRIVITGALLLALAACDSGNSGSNNANAPAKPEVFGPAGYRGLTPGMPKDAAVATGKLATSPTSNLDGCADFSYPGGPAPDPARMAAEEAAQKKADELNKKADEAGAKSKALKPGKSAQEQADAAKVAAESAQLYADAAAAIVDVVAKREDRDKAFAASGGASFGKTGLRELAAPKGAKTAEGIGDGSTVDELRKAYDARGLKLGANKRYQLAIAEKPGWLFEFVVTDNRVIGVSMISEAKCA